MQIRNGRQAERQRICVKKKGGKGEVSVEIERNLVKLDG
jgi:hypothetical protein